jgi:hypothetical protein
MHIVEAYTKFKGQCVILFSGFSGSNKTDIAHFIAKLLKFQFVKLSRFYKSTEVFDKDENYIQTKTSLKILGWDDIYKSVDWDKFNEFVNQNKQSGLVVVGFGFPKQLLKFDVDFSVHIKISKQQLVENQVAYAKKHNPEVTEDELQKNKMILNSVTYPLYLKILEDSVVSQYNISGSTEIETRLSVFRFLTSETQKWLAENVNNQSNKSNQSSYNNPQTNQYGNNKSYNKGNTSELKLKRINHDFDSINVQDTDTDTDKSSSSDSSDISDSSSD